MLVIPIILNFSKHSLYLLTLTPNLVISCNIVSFQFSQVVAVLFCFKSFRSCLLPIPNISPSFENPSSFECTPLHYSLKLPRLCPCAQSLQSCPTLCDPMDCGPPGSSIYGLLQGRIPEWAAIPFSRGPSCPGTDPISLRSPALAGGFFTTSDTWEAC